MCDFQMVRGKIKERDGYGIYYYNGGRTPRSCYNLRYILEVKLLVKITSL